MDGQVGTSGVPTACAECGAANPLGTRFCGRCGHRLSAPVIPPSPGIARRGGSGRLARPGEAQTGRDGDHADPPRPGRPRPVSIVAGLALVALVAGGVVLARGGPAPAATIAATSRGDAGWTGVYDALPGAEVPQDLVWRDVWTAAPPDRQVPPRRPVATGLGYLVATTGGVALFDRHNGAVRWRAELSVSTAVDPLPLDVRAVVVAGTDTVTVLDAVEGVRLWQTAVPDLGEVRALAATGRTLAVAGADGGVALLDLARGSLRVRLEAAELLGATAPVTVEDIVVAAGRFVLLVRGSEDADARVVALDTDGAVAWTATPPVDAALPLLAGPGTVIATQAEGGVLALAADGGEVRWRWRPSADEAADALAAVAVTPDGSRVLVVSAGGTRRTLGTSFGNLIQFVVDTPLPVHGVGPVDDRGRVPVVLSSGAVEVVGVGSALGVATVPAAWPGRGLPLVDGDRLLVGLPGGEVVAEPIGPTGTSWRASVTPAAACGATGAGDAVLVADGDIVRIQEADSGTRRWSFRPPGGATVTAPAGSGELVVTTAPTGTVTAADAATGEVRWTVPGPVDPVGPPVLAGDLVITASGGSAGAAGGPGTPGAVVALAQGSGETVWSSDLGAPVAVLPSVAGERLVVATSTGDLVGLDLASGNERWRVPVAAPVTAPPVQAGTAIVVTDAEGVSTLVVEDGAVHEVARTDVEVPLDRAPAVAGDLILMRSDSTRLVAIDLLTHRVRWEAVTTTDVLTTPPTVIGQLVVVGGQRGLQGFDLTTGRARADVQVGPLVGTVSATREGAVVCRSDGSLLVLR